MGVQHLIFWGVIGSLAAALYYQTSTLWYVLVFFIVNVMRLLRVRGGQASPVFTIPALVISGKLLCSRALRLPGLGEGCCSHGMRQQRAHASGACCLWISASAS